MNERGGEDEEYFMNISSFETYEGIQRGFLYEFSWEWGEVLDEIMLDWEFSVERRLRDDFWAVLIGNYS